MQTLIRRCRWTLYHPPLKEAELTPLGQLLIDNSIFNDLLRVLVYLILYYLILFVNRILKKQLYNWDKKRDHKLY